MIGFYKTLILIFKIYKFSHVSEDNTTEQYEDNDMHCQVSIKKIELSTHMGEEGFKPYKNEDNKIEISDAETSPEKALKHFEMVKNLIKIYRPMFVEFFKANTEKHEISDTFKTFGYDSYSKKKTIWRKCSVEIRIKSDIALNECLNAVRKRLKHTSQKITNILRLIRVKHLFLQLNGEQKMEFLNFTSDLWEQKFNQIIKYACGFELMRELKKDICKFKNLREEIWQNCKLLNEKKRQEQTYDKELGRLLGKRGDYTLQKFIFIRKLALSRKYGNQQIFANQIKLSLVSNFSNNQNAEHHKAYYDKKIRVIDRAESIKKNLTCLDFIEGVKCISLAEKNKTPKNEECNKEIDNLLQKSYPFYDITFRFEHLIMDIKEQISKLSYDSKCKLLDKLNFIQEKADFIMELLKKKFEQERKLLGYEKEKDRKKELYNIMDFIQEFIKHSEIFFRLKKNIYIDRLKNIKVFDEKLASDVMNSIMDAINKSFLREKKIANIIEEMKKDVDANVKNILWCCCDEIEFDFAKSRITLPRIDDFKMKLSTQNEMLVDFTEQLVLQNLKKIENELENVGNRDNKSKSIILILKCNLNFKSPIYLDKNLFEVSNEVKNIIYEILIDYILDIKAKTRKTIDVTENDNLESQNKILEIKQLTNAACDKNLLNENNLENTKRTYYDNLYNKWNNQLSVYWNTIYYNTTVSCYKTNNEEVKNYVESQDKTFYKFDLEFKKLKKNEKKCYALLKIRYEIAFIWFFFYMRTYTLYLTNAFIDIKIPHDKLNELLVKYNIYDNFMQSSYEYWTIIALSKRKSLNYVSWFGSLSKYLITYMNYYTNQLNLLLLDSIAFNEI